MKRTTMLLAAMLVPVLVGAVAPSAQACFCICYPYRPLQVWEDHVEVVIRDQVCTKTYRVVFYNPNSHGVQGATVYMELERGAKVENLVVSWGNKRLRADVLEAEEAKKLFEEALKKGVSPAVLESYGKNLIRIQVPRVGPGAKVQLELSYTTVLESQNGLVRLQLPNTKPKGLVSPIQHASVRVKLFSSRPIKNVYSPTHPIRFEESDEADLVVLWDEKEVLPQHAFVLYYQQDPSPVGATLLAYRELDEEGYFLLMLSPTLGRQGEQLRRRVLPKDVVFCVDTSGSMLQEGKMEQAREALRYCLKHLRPQDRFNVVQFNTRVKQFRPGLVPANKENVEAALAYVDSLRARGGTAMAEALQRSLAMLEEQKPQRVRMIFFSTDGYPTIGLRDPDKLLRQFTKANAHGVRLFVFGQGMDVNARLLDLLALQNRGAAEYLLPQENLAQKIRHYFDRVGAPLLTSVQVEFDSAAQVADVFPQKLPDLFYGQQLIVVGRYRGVGPARIKLRGQGPQGVQELEYRVEFPEFTEEEHLAFVGRIWAGHKVDALLAELRAQGKPDQKLIDQITYLAKRFGIVTPYTSMLLAQGPQLPQGGRPAPVPLAGALRRQVQEQLQQDRAAAGAAKAAQFHNARVLNAMRQRLADQGAAAAFDLAASELAETKTGRKVASAPIQQVGGVTFFNRQGTWYDNRFPGGKTSVKQVRIGSPEFFQLLRRKPKLARILALGNVVLQIDGVWYHVLPSREKN